MAKICVDTGFLIALYSPRDEHHSWATEHFRSLFADDISRHVFAVPWPVLYEALNTRMARRRPAFEDLTRDWKTLEIAGRLNLLSDVEFRDAALKDQLGDSPQSTRALSLADRVIRAILCSRNAGVNAFVTCNPGDFADACARNRIQLIDHRTVAAQLRQL